MGRARLHKDGTYHGDLQCRYCGALIEQGGRSKPRLYCRLSHRLKNYGAAVIGVVTSLF